ncbi:MAG: hypothetical protein C5B58_07560, partial [Acidobacteria bacterium]
PVVNRANSIFGPIVPLDSSAEIVARSPVVPVDAGVPLIIGGLVEAAASDRTWVVANYNGKIDSPKILNQTISADEAHTLARGETPANARLAAYWDFSHGISARGMLTDTIVDVSGNQLNGRGINQPEGAMTGWNWRGIEEVFTHAPEQYGALWFHEDALDDCRWESDCSLEIPATLRSGCYAVRLRKGMAEDYIPFFVRPAPGKTSSRILLLIPTCSYLAYANGQIVQSAAIGQAVIGHVPVLGDRDLELHSRLGYYGWSTYDHYVDGQGVSFTSWRRPILNMRPKHRQEFGSLWQFPADLDIVDWLEARGHHYDVATDHDLIREGAALLSKYRLVLTGTHPEYYTRSMVEAWEDYLCEGGRGIYLGANGLYWIASTHPEKPWLMEVRKGENGARAWQARPGEYYHSTSGERGGLWRNRARAANKVWGTGFSSFGFDHCGYYVPMPDARDPRVAWIMKDIEDEQRLGDFGLVGGGAAGYETDCYDLTIGTPPHTLLIAGSEGHSENYPLVNEYVYFPYPGMNGRESPMVRADIVYFSTPKGGGVFSVSSISFAGSLSHNNYENNISTMLDNVVRQLSSDQPAPEV